MRRPDRRTFHDCFFCSDRAVRLYEPSNWWLCRACDRTAQHICKRLTIVRAGSVPKRGTHEQNASAIATLAQILQPLAQQFLR